MLREDEGGQFFVARAILLVILVVFVIYATLQWDSGCRGTSFILLGVAAMLAGLQSRRFVGVRIMALSALMGTALLGYGGYLLLVAGYC